MYYYLPQCLHNWWTVRNNDLQCGNTYRNYSMIQNFVVPILNFTLCQSEYRLSTLCMQVHMVWVQNETNGSRKAWHRLQCISKHLRHVPRKNRWPLCCTIIGDIIFWNFWYNPTIGSLNTAVNAYCSVMASTPISQILFYPNKSFCSFQVNSCSCILKYAKTVSPSFSNS